MLTHLSNLTLTESNDRTNFVAVALCMLIASTQVGRYAISVREKSEAVLHDNRVPLILRGTTTRIRLVQETFYSRCTGVNIGAEFLFLIN